MLEGFGFYFLLCLLSLLAGLGVLRLFALRIENSLFLAPVVTLSAWTLFLGVGILLGYSVKQLWSIGWIGTLAIAGLGLRKNLLPLWRQNKWILAIALLLPIGILFPYFWYGLKIYMGSNLPDGWSYMAYGQYLWEYPRGTEGGLAPLYQYAAHLNKTRFIASAFLAFFSPLVGTPGDTQMTGGLFWAWALFIFASTSLFFAQAMGYRRWALFLYATFCVFSGWILRLLWANNFDNALALPFLPAFAGVFHLADSREWRLSLLLALFSSAILYSYPEMAPFVLGGAFLCFLQRFWLEKHKLAWALILGSSVLLTAALIAPFFENFLSFLHGQAKISVMSQGVRPGEGYFPELLVSWNQLYAFWGFDSGSPPGEALHFILAFILFLFAGLGIRTLWKDREWGLLATIIFLFMGSLLMVFLWRYSYGAYKFFLLNWWGMNLAVIAGLHWVSIRSRNKRLWTGISIFIFLTILVHGVNVSPFAKEKRDNSIFQFKQVEKVKKIAQGQPILVGVEEDLTNEWAVYFLRDYPIHLAAYRVYMAQDHVIPYMKRARGVDLLAIRYVLTDEKKTEFLRTGIPYRRVWVGGPYSLWTPVPEEKPVIERCEWVGFGTVDFMNLSEKAGPDGQKDAVFLLEVRSFAKIVGIELRSLNGVHSIWDTIPGNGHVLLGVADGEDPQRLINQPDGSVAIPILNSKRLYLYVADNSSIRGGQTRYQVTVAFDDGRLATAVVRPKG
ncbi:MAG: hypothetical protein NTY64_15690 [Deltaproteobacteria bacterium]|nr:hypothetical protein [Deltaproteobacteria bacterium]